MIIEAYPLQWPAGWPRAKMAQKSAFDTTPARARDRLFREIQLMGGRRTILSTNVPTHSGGVLYANFAQPHDTGVAVYFEYKGKPMVFACDRWTRVQDNIHALELTIAAIRGIDRWGASDMLERAFQGFTALPAPVTSEHWTDVLGIRDSVTLEQAENVYRAKMKSAHPDVAGGSHEAAQRLNKAIADARGAIGATP